ncbi:MAG: WYL domain-containing protein [Coriobacteriia bacterium]|nr:WYL domain-containing protein [Coriobacteriia bacterium]
MPELNSHSQAQAQAQASTRPQARPQADLSVQHLEALFALLGSLKRYDVIAVDKLAERLGIDPQILRHDLELLQYAGMPPFGGGDLLPLELDEDGYLEVTGELPSLDRPLRLSFEQALALVMALEIAGYRPEDALVEKLSRVASDDTHHLDVFELARMLRVTPAGPVPAIFEAVTQALTEARCLEIEYRRSDGTRSCRVIEPWLLFAESDQWYVTAFCHLRGRAQNFRLNRIESATLGDKMGTGSDKGSGTLSCAHDKVPDPLSESNIPHALETTELPLARLRFADSAAFVEREWPGSQVKGRHGNTLEVDVPYTAGSGTWFARHVCAGAGQIEVVFPEEARRLVRDYAQQQLTKVPQG